MQTGTTAILTTKSPTQRTSLSATRVRNGLSTHYQSIAMNSTRSPQRPGRPRTHGFTNGTRTSVEVWGSKDVSHRPARTCISLNRGYSWSSIFLYVYTGRITFATIGSQYVPCKTKKTQDGYSPDRRYTPQGPGAFSVQLPGAVIGDQCSPKSIYHLAGKVRPPSLLGCVVTNESFTQIGLTELCDTAFEDIKSKLDENNIVGELFSPFTAE